MRPTRVPPNTCPAEEVGHEQQPAVVEPGAGAGGGVHEHGTLGEPDVAVEARECLLQTALGELARAVLDVADEHLPDVGPQGCDQFGPGQLQLLGQEIAGLGRVFRAHEEGLHAAVAQLVAAMDEPRAPACRRTCGRWAT